MMLVKIVDCVVMCEKIICVKKEKKKKRKKER